MTDGAGNVDDIRAEVRAWLATTWDPQRPLDQWRELLVESGWGCPTWPRQWWGRGLGADAAAAAVADEIQRAGAVGAAIGVGMALAAPTILQHGTDELKRRHLRMIASGAETWCQLFSEPGSGSDLAGLTTRATRDGDEWVVNGQKVWTTGAQHASFGMLLARTDWDAPKHDGISFFALPMHQPGVEVRPLRQMNGRASFNEVFLTDAHVPHANLVGALHGGWQVARTTLAHERGLAASLFGTLPRGDGRTAGEALEEAIAYLKTYEWYPQRAGRPDLAAGLCRTLGRSGDPVSRQQTAALHALERAAGWTADRARAARQAGRSPGPEGSLAKLLASEIARRSAAVHTGLVGAHGLLVGEGAVAGGVIGEVLLSTPAASIAGGTDEVQRNIIGERILELPREPSVDTGIAFRTVRTNQPAAGSP